MVVNKNPYYIMKICPESSLCVQSYKCEECGNPISYGKLLFILC